MLVKNCTQPMPLDLLKPLVCIKSYIKLPEQPYVTLKLMTAEFRTTASINSMKIQNYGGIAEAYFSPVCNV